MITVVDNKFIEGPPRKKVGSRVYGDILREGEEETSLNKVVTDYPNRVKLNLGIPGVLDKSLSGLGAFTVFAGHGAGYPGIPDRYVTPEERGAATQNELLYAVNKKHPFADRAQTEEEKNKAFIDTSIHNANRQMQGDCIPGSPESGGLFGRDWEALMSEASKDEGFSERPNVLLAHCAHGDVSSTEKIRSLAKKYGKTIYGPWKSTVHFGSDPSSTNGWFMVDPDGRSFTSEIRRFVDAAKDLNRKKRDIINRKGDAPQ